MGGSVQVTGQKKLWQMQLTDIKMVTRGAQNGLCRLLVGSERALPTRDCGGGHISEGFVFEVGQRW